MTATTALTAQNTTGVYGVHLTPADFVAKQIDACISDVGVDVVKTGWSSSIFPGPSPIARDYSIHVLTLKGMLASAQTISVVADALRRHSATTTVIDPV